MGKWKSDGEFHIESHLNKPPKILLKAVELLQSDHDFEEGEIKQYIEDVAVMSTKLPALKQYRFPGRTQDQLFKASYRHIAGDDCRNCEVEQAEERLSRALDDPAIHYGVIASGNAVVRSAEYRDELRNAWKVSCFEMEAAGLMDDFPCLVIRGICDYSDDHKNKVWQPYSAVVAAAYAKDLLRVIQPTEVEIIKAAIEVMGERKFKLSSR
jgi:nucleoside phosphorylase